MSDYIKRADAIEAMCDNCDWERKCHEDCDQMETIKALPSADAVLIHEDGTLEVKVPNAHKVGRVLVMDTDSHIGGGLFYPESADAVQGWIPCSEKFPSDDEIVNITWVNHNPPPYYADIAEKPFVASGLRYRDKWYWYSSVCQDLHQDFDIIDKDIEVIAWQTLPKPYKGGDLE